jgi:hypothetical protein
MLLSLWFGNGYGRRAIDILPLYKECANEDDKEKYVIDVDTICYGSDEMV